MDRTYRLFGAKLIFCTFLCIFGGISCCRNNTVEANVDTHQKVEEIINKKNFKDTISFVQLGRLDKNRIFIEKEVDLEGKVCKLPKGITICTSGGTLKNGTLIGKDTKVSGKRSFLEKVTIKGTWNVPYISTDFFNNLNYENSLKDVLALASPNEKNTIVIKKGVYQVRAMRKSTVCLALPSNTDFILNGTIQLVPNDLRHYYILQAKGENIRISGKGAIIGDKHSHTGKNGEWGMGIRFHHATNSSVKGITIKDCWGDCIYVGGNSQSITIEDCRLDHGRRQGISVTSANGVSIRNCKITNIIGTAPEYAIDLEPNKGDTVDNVMIEKVIVKDCKGGFLATRSGKKDKRYPISCIGCINIKNCQVNVEHKFPMRFKRCESVIVEKNKIKCGNNHSAIYANFVNDITIKDNFFKIDKNIYYSFLNTAKKAIGKKDVDVISVVKSKVHLVKNNKILTK